MKRNLKVVYRFDKQKNIKYSVIKFYAKSATATPTSIEINL